MSRPSGFESRFSAFATRGPAVEKGGAAAPPFLYQDDPLVCVSWHALKTNSIVAQP
jgi:hypothetical protein